MRAFRAGPDRRSCLSGARDRAEWPRLWVSRKPCQLMKSSLLASRKRGGHNPARARPAKLTQEQLEMIPDVLSHGAEAWGFSHVTSRRSASSSALDTL